jgi:hypothetical protein
MDTSRLDEMKSSLAVDGYVLDVREDGPTLVVTITADPETCADCLVPKPIMLSMLEPILGVDQSAIRLRYPSELVEPAHPHKD